MLEHQQLLAILVIGAGATALLDLWLLLLRSFGVPTGSFALVGRWIAHMLRGRFMHASIAKAEPAGNEELVGWVTHYAVGVAFAAVLVALQGSEWIVQPTFAPALATGVATVAMPLFVMQPAMGSGIAASRTPTPLKNCARSIVNHAVFGMGLYAAAMVFAAFSREFA